MHKDNPRDCTWSEGGRFISLATDMNVSYVPGFRATQSLFSFLKAELSGFSPLPPAASSIWCVWGVVSERVGAFKINLESYETASPSTVRVAFAETLPALF